MIITQQALLALRTSASTIFNAAFAAVEPKYKEIAMVVPSSSKSNTYSWLGKMPKFREWFGSRVYNDVKEYGYTITNKKFENTVSVERDDIEDDLLGTYTPLFSDLGKEAAQFPDELVFGALRDGFKNLCYDKRPFFSKSHPVYIKHDAEGKDGIGESTAVSNILVDDKYTGNTWYLLDTSKAVKPIIYQTRRDPSFVAKTDTKDEKVFEEGVYVFGCDMRCNAGYGFWQMAVAVKAELNAENLKKARAMMRAFKADGGKSLGVKPTLLVVPVSLEDIAESLLSRDLTVETVPVQTGVDAAGNAIISQQSVSVSNDMKNKVKLLVSEFL